MFKMSVAFAGGLILLFPTLAFADKEKPDAREFKQERLESLGGSYTQIPKQAGPKSDGLSPPSTFGIDQGRQTKPWLVPTKFDSSEDQNCNGRSVEDFLKGTCNKLHGFDIVSPDRPKKLPPAWGVPGTDKLEDNWQQYPFFEYLPTDRYENYNKANPLKTAPGKFAPKDFGLPGANPNTNPPAK